MTDTQSKCDDNLLLEMLRTDENLPSQQHVIGHVEDCQRCQMRLAELAASGGEWKTAASVLSTRDDADDSLEFELEQTVLPHLAHLCDCTDRWTESMATRLLDPPSHPEMLGRLGRYEIERLIGSGGMGIVFKAHDTELNRPVAIKMLAPFLASSGSARKRFAREARSAAGIVDDHVVPIYNVESEGDPPFLVMQYVAGGSLQEKLDRSGPLGATEIVRIGLQAAKGLAAAHDQGLIHRDVKPSNILLDEGVERALLTDFGLARTEDDARLTRSGFQPGTPNYMSPEQIRGESIDGRSDLFGLGCILYALCTGRPPFRAESGYAVLRRITDDVPRPVREVNSDIPDWLQWIVMKLLEKDPEQRFQSADEVAETLSGWLAHVQQPNVVSAPAWPNPPQPAYVRTGRNLIKYLMGTVAGLLFLFAGVIIILETGKGTIRIESDVDHVPIHITQGDTVVETLTVTKTGASVRVAAGDYVVKFREGIEDVQIDNGTVTLARRGSEVVRITHVNQPVRPEQARARATRPPTLLEIRSATEDEMIINSPSLYNGVRLDNAIPIQAVKLVIWGSNHNQQFSRKCFVPSGRLCEIRLTKGRVYSEDGSGKVPAFTLSNIDSTQHMSSTHFPMGATDSLPNAAVKFIQYEPGHEFNVSIPFKVANVYYADGNWTSVYLHVEPSASKVARGAIPGQTMGDQRSGGTFSKLLRGKWRSLSAITFAGRPVAQHNGELVIFGERTIRFLSGAEPVEYTYELEPSGELTIEAYRDGRMADRILGRVEVSKQYLYLAVNVMDGGMQFPKHARAQAIDGETSRQDGIVFPDSGVGKLEPDVNYFVFVREPWTEAEIDEIRGITQQTVAPASPLSLAVAELTGDLPDVASIAGRWVSDIANNTFLAPEEARPNIGFDLRIDKQLGDSQRKANAKGYDNYVQTLKDDGQTLLATGHISFDQGEPVTCLVSCKDELLHLHLIANSTEKAVIHVHELTIGRQQGDDVASTLSIKWEPRRDGGLVASPEKAIVMTYRRESAAESGSNKQVSPKSLVDVLEEVPKTLDGLARLERGLAGVEIELVHRIGAQGDKHTASYLIQYRGVSYCLYMEQRRWKKLYEFTAMDEFAQSENKIEPFHIAKANRKPLHYQVAAIHAAAVSGTGDKPLGFEYRAICEFHEVPTIRIQEGFANDVKSVTLTAPEGVTIDQVIETLKKHSQVKSTSERPINE